MMLSTVIQKGAEGFRTEGQDVLFSLTKFYLVTNYTQSVSEEQGEVLDIRGSYINLFCTNKLRG